jgi:xanthine/uracil permease
MGVKLWIDAHVDFADHRNMVIAGASLIVSTGLGVKGITVAGTNIAGIALGTVLALVLNLVLRPGRPEGAPPA